MSKFNKNNIVFWADRKNRLLCTDCYSKDDGFEPVEIDEINEGEILVCDRCKERI